MQEIFFPDLRNSDSFVQGRGSLGLLVVVARNRPRSLAAQKARGFGGRCEFCVARQHGFRSEHNSMMERSGRLRDLPAEQQRRWSWHFSKA